MYRGYQTIFWGIFLASFHINLGSLKIIPAFAAWFIVSVGIKKLNEANESVYFTKAVFFADMAVILSIISGVLSLIWQGSSSSILMTLVWPVAFGVVELLTEYTLLTGSIESLLVSDKMNFAVEYTKKTQTYSIFFIILIIIESISLTFLINEFIIITAVYGIILRIAYMIMMGNLKNIFGEDENMADKTSEGESLQ